MVVKALASRYGLVFFLRSDCPFCHRFAQILKSFASRYGFSILPVSLDGKGLPEFPNPRPNALLASNLNVKVVPTVFLVDSVENILIPVSYGYTDASTLAKKILWAAKMIKQQKDNIGNLVKDTYNPGPSRSRHGHPRHSRPAPRHS